MIEFVKKKNATLEFITRKSEIPKKRVHKYVRPL